MKTTHEILVETKNALPKLTASKERKNAALLAIEMLALTDERLKQQLLDFRRKQTEKVLATTI